MLTPEQQRNSQRYGTAQTVLLLLYAAAITLDRSPLFFAQAMVRSVGTGLCMVGVLLMLWAIYCLRRVVQIAPEPKEGGHLTVTGVYRWLRHPIYTAIIVVVVGLFLQKSTVVSAAAGAVVTGFLLVKVRFEEKLLLTTYPGYAEYKARVCGVLPGW